MGLDQFGWRTKHKAAEYDVANNGWQDVYDDAGQDEGRNFSAAYKKMLKKLSSVSQEEYHDAAVEELKKLAKKLNYPEFDLNKIGYDTVFENGKKIEKIEPVDLQTLTDMERSICDEVGCFYEIYFRKVNCLYAYFQNKGKLTEEVAWIDKEDAEDIIERCQKIKKDHKLAKKLLPTQAGFFFGNTEYDEWYYRELGDIIKQFKKILKGMEKGWSYFFEMNW